MKGIHPNPAHDVLYILSSTYLVSYQQQSVSKNYQKLIKHNFIPILRNRQLILVKKKGISVGNFLIRYWLLQGQFWETDGEVVSLYYC